jgi:hypothetical protein
MSRLMRIAVAWLLVAAPIRAAAAGPSLFRVILKDGTAVSSFGEYARVGERIVFSMPIGPVDVHPQLQLVSLPVSAIDWEGTERYADSVRYARYVETRGEEDFAVLTGEVAETLKELSAATDPEKRLTIAEGARATLADWPRTHFGYRSTDVRDMVSLLDEAISELRARSGTEQFSLSLVAVIEPPNVPLLPDPTPAQTIEQALAVAKVADVSAERTSVYRAVMAGIDTIIGALPPAWAKRTRDLAAGALEVETRADEAYGRLARRAMAAANSRATEADVRGVGSLLGEIRRSDAALGRKRPDEVAALVGAVEERLDAARRLRLARDRWALRADAIFLYRDRVSSVATEITRLSGRLDEIRLLAGPRPAGLPRLGAQLSRITKRLSAMLPPVELEPAHALLMSSCQLAQQAVQNRERAVTLGDMRVAWDASAAAAGSMMLFSRARADMDALFKPPELR